jgi:hypothetical protein
MITRSGTMTRLQRSVMGAAMIAALTGCNDFLTGDGISSDPNFPTVATREQLFVGFQASQFNQQEGSVALLTCLYMQQCSGTANFVQEWDVYNISAEETDANFVGVYTGGGLVDLRAVQASAEEAGDDQYLGIAKVWEALAISFAADNWGDVPYSEAVDEAIPTPAFDDQLAIYAALQTLLTEAIADLAGEGPGPGPADLIYGGDVQKWTRAAYTLKARLHMHTAEKLGDPAYTAAIAAAANGILAPADDFRTLHAGETAERNLWFQFYGTSFGQYAVAGKRLVDLMVARSDPRLPQYFGLNAAGTYGGKDVNGATPANQISRLNGTRNVASFRQPILTADETELILAEAKLKISGPAEAAPHLTTVRQRYGQLPIAAPTLNDIMTEKYIALFQNIEVWQDYKRTCLPVLTPVTDTDPFEVPGRIYYGSTEQNANPNTPSTAEQLQKGGVAGGRPGVGGFRNPNDPTKCT